ncbi:MAG: MFS transporter [Thermoplasmata archaeon]
MKMGKKRGQSFNLLAATFLGTMDSNALVPVIAFYAVFLGSSIELTGLIVAMYSIVHVPANIVLGRLADKIGRRNPLVFGLLWDAFSVFLYSLARNPIHLLLVRFSHGLGGGFVGPSSMAIAASLAPEGRKGRMMALYGIALAFSVIVGFMLSGIIVSRLGYEMLFYVLSASLIVAVAFALSIKEPEDSERVKTTFKKDLANILDILKRKLGLTSYSSIFCLYFVMGAFTVLVPLFMRDFGMTEIHVAISFTTFAFLSMMVHYPSGWLSDRIGAKVPAIAGLLTIALSMLLLPFFHSLLSLLPLMALFGIGHGLVFPSASTMIVQSTSADERGLASGVFYALLVAGVAVGAPIAAFLASIFSIEVGIWAAAFACVIGFCMVLGLLKNE